MSGLGVFLSDMVAKYAFRVANTEEGASAQKSFGYDVQKIGAESVRRNPLLALDSFVLYTQMIGRESRVITPHKKASLEDIVEAYYKCADDNLKVKIAILLKLTCAEKCHLPKDIIFEIILNLILEAEYRALETLAAPSTFVAEGVEFSEEQTPEFFYQQQVGSTTEMQIKWYSNSYKLFPSQILNNSKLPETHEQFINVMWLTAFYMKLHTNIAEYNPENAADQLYKLDIHDQRTLLQVPSNITRVEALEELYLYSNNLTALPSAFGMFNSLTVLSIVHNNIRFLPPEIGQLKKLEKFAARDNKLEALPPEIGQLKALKNFDVSDNNLTNLPDRIVDLPNLQILNIARNKFSDEVKQELKGKFAAKRPKIEFEIKF